MTQPLFYKDLLSQRQALTEQELGRKGVSLALLVTNNVPVPPFFIIRPDVFKSIISSVFQEKDVASLEVFRSKLDAVPLPPQVVTSIESYYQMLSGFGKAWVAVRSSVVAPLHAEASFSGLLASLLNVRGINDIERAVKDVYLSLFQDRAYDYLKDNNISYGDIGTAVIVQKMIQAEVSGVMYTYDPITLNKDHVSIEAVFGLGDVLTDGSVNPDIYTVAKGSQEIIEKKVVPQEWMRVRKIGDTQSVEHLQKITISKVWQYSQKLDDALIRELARLAETIEQALGGPQLIEWTMERGSLYVLQAKPIETAAQTMTTIVPEAKQHKVQTMQDLDSFVEKHAETEVSVESAPEEVPQEPKPTETLLFLGTPASFGEVYGEAVVLPNAETIGVESLDELHQSISKKHIIVTNEFRATLEPIFSKAGGVVTNYGGVNSDAALNAREVGIPAVVGTRIATSFLQTGMLIKVDGSSGAVYRVDRIPTVSEAKTREVPELPTTSFPETRKAEPVIKEKITPPKSARPRLLFLPAKTSSKNVIITADKLSLPATDTQNVLLFLNQVNRTEIQFIKKLKKATYADIYLVLSDTPSFETLLKGKRALAAASIRRTKRVKLLISITTLYGLLNSKNLADIAVDGFLYDVPALATAYHSDTKSIDDKLWQIITDNVNTLSTKQGSFIGISLPAEFMGTVMATEVQLLRKPEVSAFIFPTVTHEVTESQIASFYAHLN